MAWNVLILGGGFGGLYAARKLERMLPPAAAKVTRRQRRQLHALHAAPAGRRGRDARAAPRRRPAARAAQAPAPQARARSPAPIRAPPRRRRSSRPRATRSRSPTTSSSSRSARRRARCRSPAWRSTRWASRRSSEAIALRNRLVQTLETAESIDDDAARDSLLTYVVRRRGLRGRRGTRRAAGLRRRRARALPALPAARPALHDRGGARPADARDLAGARGVRRQRAAAPRDRDPARARRSSACRPTRPSSRPARSIPTRTRRLDGGRQAAPDRREARAAARRRRPHQGRPLTARSRASTTCGRSATPPRCPTRRDPASRARRRASTRSARAARSATTSPPRSATPIARSRSSTRRSAVFVDMGRHQAVAETARDQLARLPGVVPRPHLPPVADARATAGRCGSSPTGPSACCSAATPRSSASSGTRRARGDDRPGGAELRRHHAPRRHGLTGAALALVLASAALHAMWNTLLADAEDTHASTAVALLAAAVVFAPVAALTWDVDGAAVPVHRSPRRPASSCTSRCSPPPTRAPGSPSSTRWPAARRP